jgi:hypothetical protein
MSWFLPVLFVVLFLALVVYVIYRSIRRANLPKRGGGGSTRPPTDRNRTVR